MRALLFITLFSVSVNAQVVGGSGSSLPGPYGKDGKISCKEVGMIVLDNFYKVHKTKHGKEYLNSVYKIIGSKEFTELRNFMNVLVVKYQQYVQQKVKDSDTLSKCGLVVASKDSTHKDKELKKLKALRTSLDRYSKYHNNGCNSLTLGKEEIKSYLKVLDAVIDLNK